MLFHNSSGASSGLNGFSGGAKQTGLLLAALGPVPTVQFDMSDDTLMSKCEATASNKLVQFGMESGNGERASFALSKGNRVNLTSPLKVCSDRKQIRFFFCITSSAQI